jgi:flagellar biosynthesis/type III secretory pathway M-ring protein FliF/YscJ
VSHEHEIGEDDETFDDEQRDSLEAIAASWKQGVANLDERYRRVVWKTNIIAFVSIATVVFCFILLAQASRESARNRRALCTLRLDLEQRVRFSERYLKDHPHGAPDIPRKTIVDGIKNQRRTIVALGGLDCRGVVL